MAGTRKDAEAQAMWAAYEGGANIREVAEQFGRARSTVQAAFLRRGWPLRDDRAPAATPEAKAEARRLWHAERRQRLNALKLAAGCADCGYNAHPAALQFDHLDGETKDGNLSKNLARSWAWIEAEIAKCEVVCANCHAVRTAERGYSNAR